MGSFLVDGSTKGTIWRGVVPTCVKLATHTRASGEELPPPTAFCWGKSSNSLSKRLPRHIIKLKRSKREVVVGPPVCLDFWFPDLSVEGLKRKTRLLDTTDTEPHVLFRSRGFRRGTRWSRELERKSLPSESTKLLDCAHQSRLVTPDLRWWAHCQWQPGSLTISRESIGRRGSRILQSRKRWGPM